MSERYGQGVNYQFEVALDFHAGFSHERALRCLDEALSLIDHKALGVDVHLGCEPTSAALCSFIAQELL